MWYTIDLLLSLYLGLSALYILTFAVAAKRPLKKEVNRSIINNNSIGVLIPSYKEDRIILDTAQQALKQTYSNYKVIVIADKMKPKTLEALKKMPLILIEVSFAKSSKLKSLKYALEKIPQFDSLVILDADNVMQKNYLENMNTEFNRGYPVIQSRRVAKITKTNIQYLDALSEAINNNIYNLGCNNLSFSSRFAGSGLLIDYKVFRNIIANINEKAGMIGAEDKFAEMELIKSKISIRYNKDITLFDAKTDTPRAFKNQRARWITAQFYTLRTYFKIAFDELLTKGNTDLFNKWLQMALPPRLLLFAFLGLGVLFHFFFNTDMWIFWTVGFTFNLLANLISIPKTMYTKEICIALISIPYLTLLTILSLFKIRKAKKEFLSTREF